ncbi:MAG: ATP-binding protein, partial [Bacteroidales bacterium]|nr:ATP-binding protein [Bacteroidales bacterium]
SFTEITVADTGVGMSKQQAYNLLNTWKTTSTDGTSGEKGSGLGLMLCKEFVQKHNGKIDLESSLGNGTKFIISFPKRTV